MSEAFGDLDVGEFFINGGPMRANLRNSLTGLSATRSIDGAPVLTMGLVDPAKGLLKTGIWDHEVYCTAGPYGFTLVQVKKVGTGYTLTFEEASVAAMRKMDKPRKIAPGAMSRAAFIRSLVADTPGIRFTDLSGPVEATKTELSRGTVVDADATQAQKLAQARREEKGDTEDTWEATGRLADEVGRRRFIRAPREFVYAADSVLIGRPPEYTLREESQGILDIAFDWDTGKKEASMTIRCLAKRWVSAPGSHIHVVDMGPASGNDWIVSDISRSFFGTEAVIKLIKARPILSEPEQATAEADEDNVLDDGVITLPPGYEETTFDTGPQGFMWPTSVKTVTSGFGPRWGRMHMGIDIGVGSGTAVKASMAGTVVLVKEQAGGYGKWICLQHKDRYVTLYAHLSQIMVSHGHAVRQGDVIALSGNTGSSTGPHLHFEIRKGIGFANSTPQDPRKYLP
jgi:murein DD-endopeptidase MepM/ murein hydrolase activator NlpD